MVSIEFVVNYSRRRCILCDVLEQEADLSAILSRHPSDGLPGAFRSPLLSTAEGEANA